MAWGRMREELVDDPATVTVGRDVGVTQLHAAASLMLVWMWAGRLSRDGTIPLGTLEMIDSIGRTPGLGRAMERVGWVVCDGTQLVFPKWDRHNSDAAKARYLTAERKRRGRVTLDRDAHVTLGRAREEKRREEEREEPPTPTSSVEKTQSQTRAKTPSRPEDVPLPGCLSSDDFRARFSEFCRHRFQGWPRERWTAIAASRKLATLEKLGHAEALRWVTFALDNGLKNIQEPFERKNGYGGNGHADAALDIQHQQTLRELGLA